MKSPWWLPLVALVVACGDSSAPVDMDMGADLAPSVPVTTCPAAAEPPLPSGTCAVTPGGAGLLVTGTVLVPGSILRGGQVAVDASGIIRCVGCDCTAMAAGATAIDCPTGVVSPGLVNTHDHIAYADDPPVADTGERYEQRNDWRRGERGHTELHAGSSGGLYQVRIGEVRFLMGGATSTVGSASAPGLLRNLDVAAAEEGLAHAPVHFNTFPLGDTSGLQLATGCGYPFEDTTQSIMSDTSYEPHIAEGVDAVAHNEFLCTSSTANGGQDLVQPQTAIIHAVGLEPADYALMAKTGTSMIWSPRSNLRLYGDTAAVTVAARLGVRIALGSDWLPSGSMNLLRELACADAFNRDHLGGFFSDEQLWLMVTRDAAKVAAVDDALGVLAPGKVADLAIFDGAAHPWHRAVLDATPAEVVLVVRGGTALYGDAAVVSALSKAGCEPLDVCGRAKSLCMLGDTGTSLAKLMSAGGNDYPLFACGVPDGEPTCVPSRPVSVAGSTTYTGALTDADHDGDGIPDAQDDCPRVFDPVRPLDDGKQPDADGDGIGDACDPDPLAAP